MTVGISVIGLSPWLKADSRTGSRRRVGHRHICAEVSDAAKGIHRQAGGGETELHGWIFGPGALLAVRAQQPRQVRIHVGGPNSERVGNGEETVGRDLLAGTL